MAKSNLYNNEQMLTKIDNTKTTRHTNMSKRSDTYKRTGNDYTKQNCGTFSPTNVCSTCSPPSHLPCSTTHHNCFCRRGSIAYFSAHSSHSITFALYSLCILLCFTVMPQPALTRATSAHRSAKAAAVATPPIAAQLLGNATSSASLLNVTTSIINEYEKNAVDLSATSTPAPPTLEHRRSLKRALLNNASVVCNDGSRAGFYLRKNPNSKKWIVFLEGGWHCYDKRSCRARWLRLRHLMTSAQWPETRDVGGILSPLPEENPYWHNANHVLVPYCSSDSWSGTRGTIDETVGFRFMGAVILRQVIAELIPLGLGRVPGAELLLVGSSAGGLGVMLNLDYITNYLQNERNLMVTVRGVSDSGWFIDREPYTPATVGSSEAVRQGWKLWQGSLPDACIQQYQTEPWRCYFGYRLYPTLKTPLFVFQWLFDEAQMRADNVGAPVTPQQWNYIHEMGGALRSSLDNVTGVFAPSCIGHAVLSKRDWINIKIDDISLPSALRCWEHSTRQRRRRHNDKQHHQAELHERRRHRLNQQTPPKHHRPTPQKDNKGNNQEPQNDAHPRLSKAEREERRRLRHERQQRRLRKQQRKNKNKHRSHHEQRRNDGEKLSNNLPHNNSGDGLHEQPTNKKQRHHQNHSANGGDGKHQRLAGHKTRKERKEHRQQQLKVQHTGKFERQRQHGQSVAGATQLQLPKKHANNAGPRRNRVPRVPEKCALRLLERCSWPQCNHSCPMVTNPLTGEEMRFLELLTSFGLDIEAVAAALGMDMQTLSNMDRTELVNLLTQQAS